MTRVPCKRRWAAEALEDGRLEAKDRASLERHAEACEECTQAIARVRELGRLLAELPTPEPGALERRRARAELLTRANEAMVGHARRPRRWAVAALVPALAAIALTLVVTHRRAAPPAPVVGTPAPLFEIADVDHADFSAERVDAVSRVVLRSGTASFHVEHVKPGARFLVALPDGEVEVRGTRFLVEVARGRTRSVAVTEGVVAVRVGGFDGVLVAGERWPRVEVLAPASQTTPSASPAPPASVAAARAPARRTPGPRFAEAMSSFDAGDYGEADRLFVAFAREFPSDTRAEDALFLVADARARRGDIRGARDAARDYLRRFPNGLRAPAAARLADDSAGTPDP